MTEIQEYAQSDAIIMLIGNKADKEDERVIKFCEGQRLAEVRSSPTYIYVPKSQSITCTS